ncbi:MAG: response regulator [Gammaproteobacteria bacterium]|nr:response regulator [Gammaproteobacteria bacterium]
MDNPDELKQEIKVLRESLSGLSSAILRISASLDETTVLQEVVDSARALTSASYGMITTMNDDGQVLDFITSGLTPEEHQQFVSCPDGPRLFEHFRDLASPLRISDMPTFARSLGYPSDLVCPKTFQGVPMCHRGVHVGNFYLGGKESGQEFTSTDEEVLVLFASQVATAVANARTHREEQRVRANLETLIETSPVGVVVFDTRTLKPVSFNREARRIVEGLRSPGCPIEQLQEITTITRADGREIALDEFVLARELSTGEMVRAEEVVFSIPDGRSVRTLINATPIHAEDGTTTSVIITMQDLGPLDELERQRAEFLGMVSHELRTPLTSIKGSTASVLGAGSPLPQAEIRQFFHIIDRQADHMRGLISDLLDAGSIQAGTLTVEPEPSEVADLVDQARNTFLSGGDQHTISIDLPLDLPRVMADRQRIVQVLNNLFSNAARHSPESLPVQVGVVLDGVHVAISVSDEGRGIPSDQLPYLFRKHADAAGRDGERRVMGTGLGLVICKGLVEARGGRIKAESGGMGQGSLFTFTLPVAEEADGGVSPVRHQTGPRLQGEEDQPQRILVVDDDPQILRYVRDALSAAGYAPLVTGDSEDLSRLIKIEKPELVLLDLMLPGRDGIELMETVPELANIPVIFIPGYGRDETIARALEAGAVDYIVKPFTPTELTARVSAVLRRQHKPEPFRLGALVIHYEQRQAVVADHPLELTATEFDLLSKLSLNAGRVMTYESLLHQVWCRRETNDPEVVRAFVKKLRRKLGDDAASPTYIFTVRGIGYRMAEPSEE